MRQDAKLIRQVREWLAGELGISMRSIELVSGVGEREEERVPQFCDVVVPRVMTIGEVVTKLEAMGLYPSRDRGVLHLATYDVARLAGIDIYE